MKKIYSIIVFSLVILSTQSCDEFFAIHDCNLAERYRADAFCAVVKKKYLDKRNHCQYVVDFDKPDAWLFLYGRDSLSKEGQVWNYMKIGDTIRKIKDTNTIIIKRSGARDTLFRLYYGCPDTTVLSAIK